MGNVLHVTVPADSFEPKTEKTVSLLYEFVDIINLLKCVSRSSVLVALVMMKSNKLTSVFFYASVLLLIMNFVITLSK